MKRFGSRMIASLLVLAMIMGLYGCGISTTPIDYGDAEAFEAALNAGENLEGKVVRFTADELHPDSAYGYNVWAGEHLNFISSRNPDIKTGDSVVVRADTIESIMGSWFITYEKVDNAEVTDATITSDSADLSAGINGPSEKTEESGESDNAESDAADTGANTSSYSTESNLDTSNSASFSVKSDSDTTSTAEEMPLELKDYGWFVNESGYGDSIYVDFCGIIYNPNETLIAEFPKVLVTVKNGDGSIMATEEQTGNTILPGDTITLCGMLSMPAGDLTEDAQILFDVECSRFSTSTSFSENVRSSDFSFANVSEHKGSGEHLITGEITNNSDIDVDTANVSVVLRKDGQIVFMENTFVDGLKAGKTKAFEIQRYNDWPEHDTIECSAMYWF